MNKKMSRFISALLVVAMVCAMVPAVFAAVTGVTIKTPPPRRFLKEPCSR